MTGLRLWSGGVPVDDLGTVGDDLQITTVFGDGGCGVDQVSWSMGLPRGFTHPALQQGAVVELRRGPLVVATVINDEPDVDAWKFTAKGLIHRPADFIAVNSVDTPTNNLKDALTAAVANGLEIKLPADLPNVTVSVDSADQVLTVADVLNRYCAQTNQRWGITGSGWLRFYTDPTTARWVLTPDTPSLASARGQVSRLRVRYATSVDESGSPATLGMIVVGATGKGVVESFQDITNYGALTAPQATTIAQGLLDAQAPQQSFTTGITPGPGQLTNIGDVPMDGGLWLVALDVAEGAMVRSTGWRNPDVGVSGMGFEWIAGGATWSKPSGITITPLAMAASTFSDNMAEIRAGVQAAQGAADTALAVGSPDYLQSLITADSKTTIGSLPTSAAVGDTAVIGTAAYVCTVAYASGGTLEANWTAASDPRTIALISATATAVFAADNANAAAQTAQASADGKNTVTYAASAPGTITPGVVGDTWFVFSGGQITAQYKLTAVSGSTYTWSSMQLNSAVIANLDVGKITGGTASFVQANIAAITALTINASTTTWTTDLTSTFQVQTAITGNGITTTANGSPVAVKIKSGLSVTGGNGIYTDGNVSADGDVSGAHLQSKGSATTTSAANTYMDSGGYLHQVSGSSRTIKYGIEPAQVDDDLDALEWMSLYAFHYFADPDARLMLAPMVEDMLAAGLRRYVDFDGDQPTQPSWHQLISLLMAGYQRNARRLDALEARLTQETT